MKKLLILAGLIALAGSALAQDGMKGIVVKPDALTWKDNPALPKGFQVAVILGDPTKADVVVQRLKFPPNSQIAPHTHPYSEVVTVISGTVGTDEGERVGSRGLAPSRIGHRDRERISPGGDLSFCEKDKCASQRTTELGGIHHRFQARGAA